MQSEQQHSQLKLRRVTHDDEAVLLEIYGGTRAEEMALVPWTVEQQHAFIKMQFDAQQDHYSQKYPNADHDIICDGETPVGRLFVARLDQEIRIVDLTLLAPFRGNGIGTQLLKDLMIEATTQRLPIRIYVESFNPSLKLFERLGFQQKAEHGMHFLMEWKPVDAELSD